MSSLSIPDVNVWLALMIANHIHRAPALAWWDRNDGTIAFLRITQISVLRLLTTSAAMDGSPLTLRKAWAVYDKLFTDDRVEFLAEPGNVEMEFRKRSSAGIPSPKVWADALLAASVIGHRGQLITFDKAMQLRGVDCLVLG